MKGEKNIFDLQSSYTKGVRNVFFISAVIILTGNILDILKFSNENRYIFILNIVNVVLIVAALLLYFLRKNTFKIDFGIVIYSIYLNMIIGKFLTTFEADDPLLVNFYLRDSLFVIFLLTLASFSLNKIHSFIIGITYIIFSLVFTFSTESSFLKESIFLILFVIAAYVGLTFYLVNIFENALSDLHNKNQMIETQNEFLNETNTVLEERQQTIEEQSQAIESQAQRLQHQSDELLKKNTELADLNASKDMFLSIIAHDLKNPFNIVMGYSEMLLKNNKTANEEKKLRYIESIYSTSVKIYYLFENLLNWSLSIKEKLSVKPENISLTDLLKEATDLYEGMLKEKSITVKVPRNKPVCAYADYNMISLVIRNLLSNAIKFTPVNGKITISFSDNEKYVDCSIKDTGVGIDEKLIPGIFNLDKQNISPGTDGEKGTGLGLKLCKIFVEKNNGIIKVKSKLKKGTEFIISIPKN